jgi:ketosteroid isomerase-like protein
MISPSPIAGLDLAAISTEYLAGWAARDPDRIAALHTPDTRFEIHAGSGPVEGRVAVRDAFARLFETWPHLSFDAHRLLVGERHWVLDWTLISSGGPSGDVAFDCLDVVTVDEEGLVARKDTFVDPAQLNAALGRA